MTALGKILVFLNLLFSLAVAGLMVFVYVNRTNWQKGYEEYKALYNATLATRNDLVREKDTVQAEADKAQKALQAKINDLNTKLNDQALATEQTRKLLDAERQRKTEESAVTKKLREEVELRENEVKNLAAAVAARDKAIEGHIKEKNDLRDAKVNAELQASTLKERNERLITDMENMTRKRTEVVRDEVLRTLEDALAGDPRALAAAKDKLNLRRVETARENPPPQNVEGTIKQTDATGLVTISIGSDAGLTRGHTLDVYRLNPAPEYLGQIRLMDVRPNEAVARPVSRLRQTPQPGDRVASNIVRKG